MNNNNNTNNNQAPPLKAGNFENLANNKASILPPSGGSFNSSMQLNRKK